MHVELSLCAGTYVCLFARVHACVNVRLRGCARGNLCLCSCVRGCVCVRAGVRAHVRMCGVRLSGHGRVRACTRICVYASR